MTIFHTLLAFFTRKTHEQEDPGAPSYWASRYRRNERASSALESRYGDARNPTNVDSDATGRWEVPRTPGWIQARTQHRRKVQP